MHLEKRLHNAFIEAGDYIKSLRSDSKDWVTLGDVTHIMSLFESAYFDELPEENPPNGFDDENIERHCFNNLVGTVEPTI